MTLMTVIYVLLMVSFSLLAILIFTIVKGIGFRNLFSIFRVKMRVRKGFGFVRIINQTGIPENIVYKFTGKETLQPFGEKKGDYIYKPHCLGLNEFGIPTISYRKGDAEPIDPRTGLQTVTSAEMIEEIIARAIKAEQLMANGLGDWLKDNWKTIGLGVLILIGGFLFLYMHMTDAIVAAGKSASSTIVLNASSLGK